MVMLGIDFGTSSTVAVLGLDDGRTMPLLFGETPLLISAVCVTPGGDLLVGRDAVRASRARPDAFEPHPKSRIDDGEVLLGDRAVPVAELIGAVLRRVHDEAVRVAGAPVDRLILAHPAGWGPRRRQTLREAAAIAGLPPAALVAEPVAAAAYYAHVLGYTVPPGGCLVVYDFGAGTFDASVVRPTAGGFEVLAEDGILDAGGLDVDAAIVAHLGATYSARDPDGWHRLTAPATPTDRRTSRTFWDDVRAGKEELSRTSMTTIFVPILDVEAPLGREQLEHLARPLLDRTVAATRLAVRNAGIPAEQIAAVFLVGGSSRMSLPATLLHRALGTPPTVIEQPEQVVAGGTLRVNGAEPPSKTEPPESVPSEASTPAPAEQPAPPAPTLALSDPNAPISPDPVSPAPNLRDATEPDRHHRHGNEVETATDQPIQAAEQTQASDALEIGESAAEPGESPPVDASRPGTTFEVVGLTAPARKRRRLLAVSAAVVAVAAAVAVVVTALRTESSGSAPNRTTASIAASATVTPTRLATITDHKATVFSVAFSPDRKTMATGGGDAVMLWNVTDPAAPTRLATITDHKGTVSSVAFSPDGQTMATAGEDGVIVWNVTTPATPTRLATITDQRNVFTVAFSPDRKTMATGGLDYKLMLWNVTNPATPNRLATITDHKSSVFDVAFSPDGRTMATAGGDAAMIWNVTNPAAPNRLATITEHKGYVLSVAFTPNGKTMATGGEDNTAMIWNVTNPATPARLAAITEHRGMVYSLAFTPDGKTMATTTSRIDNTTAGDNTARVWNMTNPAAPTKAATITEHNAPVYSVAFSPDGKTMATAGEDRRIMLWRLAVA
ncbi:Hsp70 family protein [Dactylosporangium sp. NPDC049140]|uniref:Hsp70 family protein n=1 Tax=Dactylosporangium sp. NPDC049140 TaxID=3155647 RepID=UPI0033CD27A9